MRDEADRAALREAMRQAWPQARIWAGNDLETALTAGTRRSPDRHSVLVLSGTGSCCFGIGRKGTTAKSGGWGHVLGDRGSGYAIAISAWREVLTLWDRENRWTPLGKRLLHELGLNSVEGLSGWIQNSDKAQIAALAPSVFAVALKGDRIAKNILDFAGDELAKDAVACAKKLLARDGSRPVEFLFAGSVLIHQASFRAKVQAMIASSIRGSEFGVLNREGAWGAIEQARLLCEPEKRAAMTNESRNDPVIQGRGEESFVEPSKNSKSRPPERPTEQRNPRSMNLDKLDLTSGVRLMLSEESRVPERLMEHATELATLIRWAAKGLARGGRLLYVGAGTSGRLGVLDASECPPTFGTETWQVQGIIAGGRRALWEAVEGSEDSMAEGVSAIEIRNVGRNDVVLGITASGSTPFVLSALKEAARRGARTALLTFNPDVSFGAGERPNLVVAINTGPEILTGSTRLKAGTATKLVLNAVSTLTMAKLGKISSNLMIDVRASNTKLKIRAARILSQLTGEGEELCRARLLQHGWKIRSALQEWKRTQKRRKLPIRNSGPDGAKGETSQTTRRAKGNGPNRSS